MDPESAARLIFGTGMVSHFLIAGALPGTALVLAVVSFGKRPVFRMLHALILHLFVIQFVLSSVSGLTLETGLSQRWPGAEKALLLLVHHPIGRSAGIGFIIIAVLCAMLLGRFSDRTVHRTLISVIVFMTTFLLSGWSIMVNSWMQHPVGVDLIIESGKVTEASLNSLSEIIMNPFAVTRFVHSFQAMLLSGTLWSLVALSLIYTGRDSVPFFRSSVLIALGLLLLQPFTGHLQFLNVANEQPNKAAAIEGYYEGSTFQIYPIGVTDPTIRSTQGLPVPQKMSDMLIRTTDEGIRPLPESRISEWPPVKRVFYSFRIMVLAWVLMVLGVLVLLSERINPRGRVWLTLGLFVLGVIATCAGWIVSEAGRQPWIIHDLVKVADAVSPILSNTDLALGLLSNVLIHLALAYLWVWLQVSIIRSHAPIFLNSYE